MNLDRTIQAILLTLALTVGFQAGAIQYPDRGISKVDVESQFGQPEMIEGPVGKPPITRWLYPEFTVVFEYDLVLHTYPRQYDLESRPTSTIAPRPETGDQLSMPQ